jgi:hypothetical protein
VPIKDMGNFYLKLQEKVVLRDAEQVRRADPV